ncbi:hypothetical protein SDC9_78642 [bioreactor metagenome]|uniref:Uncharacterized protein n=1 Tax=bioreactor metagenome TaxID=1076179 RepID=A0A644Z016_9ZZZZ
MKSGWKQDAAELVRALKQERAVAVFGLCGISLEDQHRAFQLARALGASVSVRRALLPTTTFGALSRYRLILSSGCTQGVPLPSNARLLTDERLNSAETWRNLRILQRGHTTAEAESLRALYEQIVEAEGAAFLLCQDDVSEELKTELMSFCAECALPTGLDYLQATDCLNMLGAYETALEEASGAHASFAGGAEYPNDAFALEELLENGALGAALLIGDAAGQEEQVLKAGVPLYSIGSAVPGAVQSIPAELQCKGGTVLRSDGLPVRVAVSGQSGLIPISEVLETMIAEARA